MKKVTLLTGGSRSGKSAHALELADQYKKKAFIATAVAFDKEMEDRVQKHQAERGKEYLTIEEPLDVAKAIESAPDDTEAIVLDCLTVWTGNLQYHFPDKVERQEYLDGLFNCLRNPKCHIYVVTNEVGMGIVPENALSREFRDEAGWLNQQVASIANQVIFMVSGIPMMIKDVK